MLIKLATDHCKYHGLMNRDLTILFWWLKVFLGFNVTRCNVHKPGSKKAKSQYVYLCFLQVPARTPYTWYMPPAVWYRELFYVLRGLVILIDFRIRTSFKLTLWAILTFSGGKLSRSWVRLSILSSILFRSSIVKISGSTSPTQSTKMSRTCLSSSTNLENYFRAWVLMKKYLKPFYYWGSSWVWFVALRKRIKIRGKLQKIFFYPHVRFYFFNFRAYFSLFSFCNNQFFST